MFVPSRVAAKILGVHPNTLRKWANEGKIKFIRTESGQRRYDVDEYIGRTTTKATVCYCRVSSNKQKDDLERQCAFMREKFPTAEIITDIGSGLNFKRKGLKKILERAMSGECLKVVVAHRDRLARFGIDLIRFVIEKNGGELVVLDKTELSPEQELTKDLLSILHVFSARLHGLRSYKNKISKDLSKQKATKDL